MVIIIKYYVHCANMEIAIKFCVHCANMVMTIKYCVHCRNMKIIIKYYVHRASVVVIIEYYVHCANMVVIKQLLDEVEHDIMNYQNQRLCYLPKPKGRCPIPFFVLRRCVINVTVKSPSTRIQLGRVVQSWVKITQGWCKIWIQI